MKDRIKSATGCWNDENRYLRQAVTVNVAILNPLIRAKKEKLTKLGLKEERILTVTFVTRSCSSDDERYNGSAYLLSSSRWGKEQLVVRAFCFNYR